VYALTLRHQNNADYLSALRTVRGDAQLLIRETGGTTVFDVGLYGASEMVMDGFMQLRRAGVLSRRVYDDFALERTVERCVVRDVVPADAADRLIESGVLPAVVDERELARLVRFGLLPERTQLQDGALQLPDGKQLSPAPAAARDAWNRVLSGRRLRDGRYL